MEILEMFLPLITEILGQIFLVLGTLAIGFLISFIKRKTNLEQQKLLEEIFSDAVLFAQQVFKHLDGPEKFAQAKERALLMLKDKGIELSEEQIEMLIESTLKKLKKEFGDQWAE